MFLYETEQDSTRSIINELVLRFVLVSMNQNKNKQPKLFLFCRK